jgi:hypothetical protein
VVAGNVADEFERSERHDDDDDLFTSSIDTTSSVVSKGSKSKHRHKKKSGRSDSQLSNASSKTSQKESKTTSNKDGKCVNKEMYSRKFNFNIEKMKGISFPCAPQKYTKFAHLFFLYFSSILVIIFTLYNTSLPDSRLTQTLAYERPYAL